MWTRGESNQNRIDAIMRTHDHYINKYTRVFKADVTDPWLRGTHGSVGHQAMGGFQCYQCAKKIRLHSLPMWRIHAIGEREKRRMAVASRRSVADNENRYAATEQEAQVLACSTSFLLGCSFRADHLPFVFLSSVKRPKVQTREKSCIFLKCEMA